MSHMGRPKGARHEKYSLKQIVGAVEDTLSKKVQFLSDCVGHEVKEAC